MKKYYKNGDVYRPQVTIIEMQENNIPKVVSIADKTYVLQEEEGSDNVK